MEGTSATLLFLGITNVMFQDIMKRQITTERISSFLKMALMEQKSLQQYLHFLPQAEEAVSQMDETMTSLLLELQRHDEASPIICRGLLLRIFRILNTQYEFSLSKKLRQKMNWILYEEISDYMKQHMKTHLKLVIHHQLRKSMKMSLLQILNMKKVKAHSKKLV